MVWLQCVDSRKDWKCWLLTSCMAYGCEPAEDYYYYAMLPRKLQILLLLFRFLFQLHYFHGIFYALARMASLAKATDVGEFSEPVAINNNERHAVSGRKKHGVYSSERTHSTFTEGRASLIRKLSWNKILHPGFQNKRLNKELRKRQVSQKGR